MNSIHFKLSEYFLPNSLDSQKLHFCIKYFSPKKHLTCIILTNNFQKILKIFFALYSFRTIILTTIILLIGFYATADEVWRLRYSALISGRHEITRDSISSSAELSTSGHNVNFVFANGIGLGYSTAMAKGNLEDISYKFKNSSLDLSYKIGRSFSITLGTGIMIYGRGEIILDDEGYTTESISGESIFLNLGIPFFGVEFLLGYRQDNSKFKNYQCQMSGNSVILNEQIIFFSEQINAGIGFFF